MQEQIINNAVNITKEDSIFYFVIHGFAPEFCDGIAFRTDNSIKYRRLKNVDCPFCGRVFEKVDIQTKVEVFRGSKKSAGHIHKFRPCKICYGFVGIKYA